MKSRAKIIGGRWQRRVPWKKQFGSVWRTDMFKTVLADERLKEAAFICKQGPTIVVSATELKRVLPLGRDHYYKAQIWGPFSIDSEAKTIDGHPVGMTIESKEPSKTSDRSA